MSDLNLRAWMLGAVLAAGALGAAGCDDEETGSATDAAGGAGGEGGVGGAGAEGGVGGAAEREDATRGEAGERRGGRRSPPVVSCSQSGVLPPGTEQPGGPGTGVLLTCSDKLALWSALGVQVGEWLTASDSGGCRPDDSCNACPLPPCPTWTWVFRRWAPHAAKWLYRSP